MTSRKDELSLHMRLPAEKCFVRNALLTLEGICEHFSVSESSKERTVETLEKAICHSIDHFKNKSALIDLKFTMFKDKLLITVEDCMIFEGEQASCEDQYSNESPRCFKALNDLSDGFQLVHASYCKSCYSMQFNLVLAE